MPRPYPTFLPYYFETSEGNFDLADIESVQLSIGPGLQEGGLKEKHGIAIESIYLK